MSLTERQPPRVSIFDFSPQDITQIAAQKWHLLDPREQERAQRLVVTVNREQFVAARAALRMLLGQALDCPPKTVQIRLGSQGKPWVEAPFHFNLSHSGDRMLIALSRSVAVGVDLEKLQGVRPVARLAARFLHQQDARLVQDARPELQQEIFIRIWVRLEAFLKARGSGLTDSMSQFFVGLDGYGLEDDRGHSWQLTNLDAEEGYLSALCVEGSRPSDVRRFGGCMDLLNSTEWHV